VPELRYWGIVVAEFEGPRRSAPKADLPEPDSPWKPPSHELIIHEPGSFEGMVLDPDALDGAALKLEGGVTQNPSATIIYSLRELPGRYRASFRLKVADNASGDRVATLRVAGASRDVKGADFDSPHRYQEFALEFTRSTDGALRYWLDNWDRKTDLWIDRVTVTRLSNRYDGEGYAELPPQPTKVNDDVCDIHLSLGAWHYYYRLDKAIKFLPLPRKVTRSYLKVGFMSMGKTLRFYPDTLEELFKQDVLVLADVPTDETLGPNRRQLIKQYVHSGGALLILGGPFSLGKDRGLQWTGLKELLPVELEGPWSLKKADSPLALQPAGEDPIVAALDWPERPSLLYYYSVRPKPGSRTVLEAGGRPVMVLGDYGKGRVAVFAGTVLGIPPQGTVPFWEWKDWPALLGRTLQWLSGGPVGRKPREAREATVSSPPDIPIAVVETERDRIVRLNPDGSRQVLGERGTGRGQFWWPTDVAVEPSGTLLVLDHFNHRIVRTDWEGNTWQALGPRFNRPQQLLLDRKGRIYVSNINTVIRFDDLTGKGWTVLGGQPSGGPHPDPCKFCHPTGMAFDSEGRFYITNCLPGWNRSDVVRVDDFACAAAKLLNFKAGPLARHKIEYPTSVAVDAEGRIYVADCGTDRIVRVDDMEGNGFAVLKGFSFPIGLNIDKKGRIWIADTGNNRIVRIEDITGEGWTVFAGFDRPHQVVPLD